METAGYVSSLTLTTTAQRTADPVGSGIKDWNNYRKTQGNYDDWFPGVYLTYNIRKNLLLRANWSNSIGRPALTDLVPTFTVNDTTQVVTVNNAGLGPQTSENWDLVLEYYFEPVGSLTANVFRKNMGGFLVDVNVGMVGTGPDNGFGGDYAGYSLNSTFNGGEAKIEGFELGYQQRFEFLPKPFSGLSLYATYTWLKTNGDYGTFNAAPPSTTDVVDFIPRRSREPELLLAQISTLGSLGTGPGVISTLTTRMRPSCATPCSAICLMPVWPIDSGVG